jgi:hypothetical protein
VDNLLAGYFEAPAGKVFLEVPYLLVSRKVALLLSGHRKFHWKLALCGRNDSAKEDATDPPQTMFRRHARWVCA